MKYKQHLKLWDESNAGKQAAVLVDVLKTLTVLTCPIQCEINTSWSIEIFKQQKCFKKWIPLNTALALTTHDYGQHGPVVIHIDLQLLRYSTSKLD